MHPRGWSPRSPPSNFFFPFTRLFFYLGLICLRCYPCCSPCYLSNTLRRRSLKGMVPHIPSQLLLLRLRVKPSPSFSSSLTGRLACSIRASPLTASRKSAPILPSACDTTHAMGVLCYNYFWQPTMYRNHCLQIRSLITRRRQNKESEMKGFQKELKTKQTKQKETKRKKGNKPTKNKTRKLNLPKTKPKTNQKGTLPKKRTHYSGRKAYLPFCLVGVVFGGMLMSDKSRVPT